MDNIKETINSKVHFVGKHKYRIDQTPQEAQLIKEIDTAINEIIKDTERETGQKIILSEGDRCMLRWEFIKAMLIERGADPAALDEMAQAVISATEKAITERERFIDSFKIVK